MNVSLYNEVHKKYLTGHKNGSASWNADSINNSEIFTMTCVDAEKNLYTFKTCFGKYLSAQPNGKLEANRPKVGGYEKFEVFFVGDNKANIKSKHGKYLCSQDKGKASVDRKDADTWELITFE